MSILKKLFGSKPDSAKQTTPEEFHYHFGEKVAGHSDEPESKMSQTIRYAQEELDKEMAKIRKEKGIK